MAYGAFSPPETIIVSVTNGYIPLPSGDIFSIYVSPCVDTLHAQLYAPILFVAFLSWFVPFHVAFPSMINVQQALIPTSLLQITECDIVYHLFSQGGVGIRE
jgi:hypothetical protein